MKSESYLSSLLRSLQELRNKQVACDLILTSKDGVDFPCHKVMMAAASGFLRLKIQTEMGNDEKKCPLPSVDSDCLKSLVEFAYSGNLDLTATQGVDIWSLLSACTELQMTDALHLCHKHLKQGGTLSQSTTFDPQRSVSEADGRVQNKTEMNKRKSSTLKVQEAESDTVLIKLEMKEPDHDPIKIEPSSSSETENDAEDNPENLTISGHDIDSQEHGIIPGSRSNDLTRPQLNDVNMEGDSGSGHLEDILSATEDSDEKTQGPSDDVVLAQNDIILSQPNTPGNNTNQPENQSLQVHNQFTCKSCTKHYLSRAALEEHCNSVHKNIRYPCTESNCPKVFKTKGGLRLHLNVHRGQFKFVCHVCSQHFNYKTDFETHINRHTAKKPHHCRKCKKSFLTNSSLARHTKICGITEKMYKCIACPKTFKAKSYLSQHWETCHNTTSSYQCTSCGSMFSHRASLAKHVSRKHQQ